MICRVCRQAKGRAAFKPTKATREGRWPVCTLCVESMGLEYAQCLRCGKSRHMSRYPEMDAGQACDYCARRSDQGVETLLERCKFRAGGRLSTREILAIAGVPFSPAARLTTDRYLADRGYRKSGSVWRVEVAPPAKPTIDIREWMTPERALQLGLTDLEVRHWPENPPRVLLYAMLALDDHLTANDLGLPT